MVTGIWQMVLGLFGIAVARHRLEQRQVDAFVRAKQAYEEALGRRGRSTDAIERFYRRCQWAMVAVSAASLVAGAGFCVAAVLSP